MIEIKGQCCKDIKIFTDNVEEFQKQMADAGIYTTTADAKTLDEAPDAYKPKDEIVKYIEPTVNILYFMKPKMNIKSSDTKDENEQTFKFAHFFIRKVPFSVFSTLIKPYFITDLARVISSTPSVGQTLR